MKLVQIRKKMDPNSNDRSDNFRKDKCDAFKKRCQYPELDGCWICNALNHFTRDCPNKLILLPKPAGKEFQK